MQESNSYCLPLPTTLAAWRPESRPALASSSGISTSTCTGDVFRAGPGATGNGADPHLLPSSDPPA